MRARKSSRRASAHSVRVAPVSYPHLDLYNRQVHVHVNVLQVSLCSGRLRVIDKAVHLEVIGFRQRGLTSTRPGGLFAAARPLQWRRLVVGQGDAARRHVGQGGTGVGAIAQARPCLRQIPGDQRLAIMKGMSPPVFMRLQPVSYTQLDE